VIENVKERKGRYAKSHRILTLLLLLPLTPPCLHQLGDDAPRDKMLDMLRDIHARKAVCRKYFGRRKPRRMHVAGFLSLLLFFSLSLSLSLSLHRPQPLSTCD
jgi:hypothetical protein